MTNAQNSFGDGFFRTADYGSGGVGCAAYGLYNQNGEMIAAMNRLAAAIEAANQRAEPPCVPPPCEFPMFIWNDDLHYPSEIVDFDKTG